MVLYDNKKECSGCAVCALVCPEKCISMAEDEEGFAYPQIDGDSCTNCGLCRSSCAFQNSEKAATNEPTPNTEATPRVYAAKIKDKDALLKSSSGGAFTALSDWILDNNGVVFGVKFDENLTAVTSYAETPEKRDEFRGSKYMQSELRNSFSEAKEFLSQGKLVMFSGTPCQTAALKSYLEQSDKSDPVNLSNLYLCDLVCRGVSPQPLFKSSIKYLQEKKIGRRIVKYYCRYKSSKVKWGQTEAQVDEDGNYHHYYYKKIYFSANALRPCCYNCKYTNFDRPSDVTIADYMGIKKAMPDFYDEYGVSLISVNSPKGEQWLNNVADSLMLRESNRQDCVRSNPNLKKPTNLPKTRGQFWADYRAKGFEYISKKYGYGGAKGFIKQRIVLIFKKLGLLEYVNRVLRT